MGKYVREINDKRYVGVVISTDYGAGWSTWNGIDPCDENFIDFLLDYGKIDKSGDYCWSVDIDRATVESYFDEENKPYCGGADSLVICWIEEGSIIRITEYDGSERIEYLDEAGFFTV